MTHTMTEKGQRFRDLHTGNSVFIMPNAWDAGSAYLLQEAGFTAIGTTSAGIAYSLAVPDYESALGRESALRETEMITHAVNIPVSADAENGYGHEPQAVADCIKLFAQAGCVGASIEDYTGDKNNPLYDLGLAEDRIRAARAAADEVGFPFTLTARAECYMIDHEDPLRESITRANLYRRAGADCLYVPAVRDLRTIETLVREIDGPLNVVMGLTGKGFSVDELEQAGVRRISIGGSLARTTLGVVRRAAKEMMERGSFSFSDEQIPDADLCRLFSKRLRSKVEADSVGE